MVESDLHKRIPKVRVSNTVYENIPGLVDVVVVAVVVVVVGLVVSIKKNYLYITFK